MFVDFPFLLSMPPYNFTRQEAKQILEALANKDNVRIPNEEDLWGEPEWTKESTKKKKKFFLGESREDKDVIVTDRYSGCWAGQGGWASKSISLYLMTFEIGEVFDKASGATLIRVVWGNLSSQLLRDMFGAVNCCYSVGLRPSSHPDILLVLDIHCDAGVACDMKFIEFSLKDKTPVAIEISIGLLSFYGLEGVPNQIDERYMPGENPLFNAQEFLYLQKMDCTTPRLEASDCQQIFAKMNPNGYPKVLDEDAPKPVEVALTVLKVPVIDTIKEVFEIVFGLTLT